MVEFELKYNRFSYGCIFSACKRSLGQGNIFTGVCLSIVGGGVSVRCHFLFREESKYRVGSLSEGSLCPGGFCPGGLCLGGSLSRGFLFRGVLCLGVSLQGVSVLGVSIKGSLCPGGFSVRGVSV